MDIFYYTMCRIETSFINPDIIFRQLWYTRDEKKVIFHFLFNILDHQTYVGDIPDSNFFSPDGMSPQHREIFSK